MAKEAARRAADLGVTGAAFSASDLESVRGSFDTVTCIDVMIHYPTEKMQAMVTHLASLSSNRLLISFAPKVTRRARRQFLTRPRSLNTQPSETRRPNSPRPGVPRRCSMWC